jgi:hypothetical protein
VIPLVLALLGVAVLGAGFVLLRGLGVRYRVARILYAAPEVSVEEAVALAGAGGRTPPFVRVRGRVSSDEEFPDENEAPLVFRWERLELSTGRDRWQVIEEDRVAVPFGVEERGASIDVDHEALDDGLVVIPRESTGRAVEVAQRLPAGTPPETPVRHVVDQVSAVERAWVAGVPVLAGGTPTLSSGRGRPLILTTLEIPEAMRLLSAGHRRAVVMAFAAIVVGVGLLVLAAIAGLVTLVAR